jgi:hypothetical protein
MVKKISRTSTNRNKETQLAEQSNTLKPKKAAEYPPSLNEIKKNEV